MNSNVSFIIDLSFTPTVGVFVPAGCPGFVVVGGDDGKVCRFSVSCGGVAVSTPESCEVAFPTQEAVISMALNEVSSTTFHVAVLGDGAGAVKLFTVGVASSASTWTALGDVMLECELITAVHDVDGNGFKDFIARDVSSPVMYALFMDATGVQRVVEWSPAVNWRAISGVRASEHGAAFIGSVEAREALDMVFPGGDLLVDNAAEFRTVRFDAESEENDAFAFLPAHLSSSDVFPSGTTDLGASIASHNLDRTNDNDDTILATDAISSSLLHVMFVDELGMVARSPLV